MKLNGRSGLSSAAFPIVAQYSNCEVIERCSTFDLVLASLAKLSEMRITVLMLQYVAFCSYLSILFCLTHKMRHAMRKTKAQHGGAKWRCLNRLVRWFRDVRDIRACKEILWNELDQDRDETESLRTLTTVAANGLYWSRKDSSANVKMWHRLPGAPLRNRVKGCNQKGHFDSGRVAGCPPPSCSAWQLLRGEQFVIWPRMPDLAE